MAKKILRKLHKLFALVAIFSLFLQNIFLVSKYSFAQEASSTPSPSVQESAAPTTTPSDTPASVEPQQSPATTPSPDTSVSPSPSATETPALSSSVLPSFEPSPSATVSAEPTPAASSKQPVSSNQPAQSSDNQNNAPASTQGQPSDSPTTPTPTATPEEPKENGHISVAILTDTKASSINLVDLEINTEGSATLKTDKADYAPTDMVLVTGAGFIAAKSYTIIVSSPDEPAVTHEDSVTADDKGNLAYTYQLDGNYRPNYKVEVKDGDRVVASTTFTDGTGAIWTTDGSCGDSQQDVNHFPIGHNVYINGNNFDHQNYDWKITGQPGGASCDPNRVVASGNYHVGSSGAFCFNAYTVASNDCGEYDVDFGGKHDNYRVDNASGKIVIIKDSQPNDAQNFTFTRSFGDSFILDDDGNNHNTYSNTKTFTGLLTGTYTVTEGATNGWTLSNITCVDPTQDSSVNNATATINLSIGETVTCTFTNVKHGSISGHKFNDLDGDGRWENYHPYHEPALQGWTIFIDQNGNKTLDTGEVHTTTDHDGDYSFSDLVPGTYSICEVQQSGWVATHPSGNTCQTVVLSAGENECDRDFGNKQQPLGSISGHKFNDLNGNGVKDTGESYLSGWTIYLDLNKNNILDAGEPFRITDNNGYYSFTNLTPGTYRVVEIMQSGWIQTHPGSPNYYEDMPVNGCDQTVNFGNQQQGNLIVIKHVVGGTATANQWTMHINTASHGDVVPSFPGAESPGANNTLNTGNYIVTETGGPSGYTLSYSNDCDANGNVTVASNQTKTCTLTNTRNTGTLQVFKNVDLNGDGDYDDTGETGATDWKWQVNGNEYNTGDPAVTLSTGSYVVTETQKDGFRQLRLTCTDRALNGDTVTITNGVNVVCTFENVIVTGSLAGMKWNDLNDNGVYEDEPTLNGWTIFIDTNDNGLLDSGEQSTTTAFNNGNPGQYSFSNLVPGSYSVCEVPQNGWIRTFPSDYNCQIVTVTGGQINGNVNFGNFQFGKISGYKFNDLNGDGRREENEPTMSGWQICLNQQDEREPNCVQTDENGYYEFNNLNFGTYSLTETQQAGWQQIASPAAVLVTSGTNSQNNNFANYAAPELVITKSNDRGSGNVGVNDIVTYTITIKNTGKGVAHNVELQDSQPVASYFDYLENSGKLTKPDNTVVDITASGSNPYFWQIGDINPGEMFTLTYQLKVLNTSIAGTHTNIAVAQGNGGNEETIYSNYAQSSFNIGLSSPGGGFNGQTTSEQVGGVLGASTVGEVLGAATGSPLGWTILAFVLIGLGSTIKYYRRVKN